MFKLWWHRLTTKRIDIKLLPYDEADELMKNDSSWEIAEEEDYNSAIGFVFLEKREKK